MANAEPGSTLYSDEYDAYQSLPNEFTHEMVNSPWSVSVFIDR
jgi:hypothetical protein